MVNHPPRREVSDGLRSLMQIYGPKDRVVIPPSSQDEEKLQAEMPMTPGEAMARMRAIAQEQKEAHHSADMKSGSSRPTITDLVDHVAGTLARTLQTVMSLNDRISGPSVPRDTSDDGPVPDNLHGRLVTLEQWALHLEHELKRLSESL